MFRLLPSQIKSCCVIVVRVKSDSVSVCTSRPAVWKVLILHSRGEAASIIKREANVWRAIRGRQESRGCQTSRCIFDCIICFCVSFGSSHRSGSFVCAMSNTAGLLRCSFFPATGILCHSDLRRTHTHTHILKQLAVALWSNNGVKAFPVISVDWRKETILLSTSSTRSMCFIFRGRRECPLSTPRLSTNPHRKYPSRLRS